VTASGSVPARWPRTHPGSYAGSVVLVGDGQVELIVEPVGAVVIESNEARDLARLLIAARREAVQQMIEAHADITGHTHAWIAVPEPPPQRRIRPSWEHMALDNPCCAGGGATCDH